MKKTKFIRVAVDERLPIKEGDYYVKFKGMSDIQIYYFLDELHDKNYLEKYVDWFLEEIPDREDEMLQMLERSKNEFKMFKSEFGQGSELIEEIESLIQSVKQTR